MDCIKSSFSTQLLGTVTLGGTGGVLVRNLQLDRDFFVSTPHWNLRFKTPKNRLNKVFIKSRLFLFYFIFESGYNRISATAQGVLDPTIPSTSNLPINRIGRSRKKGDRLILGSLGMSL